LAHDSQDLLPAPCRARLPDGVSAEAPKRRQV